MEVKTRGGSKYFIYRRYRDFFNLHQVLESRYSPEDQERSGPSSCALPSLPGELIRGVRCHIAHIQVCQRRPEEPKNPSEF